jgi:hypothetical protein
MYVPMRNYLKEEQFLDEFYNWAAAAASAVGNEWRPNADCDDEARKQSAYFLKTGDMTWLTFSSASVHRPPNGDAYAQIVLESSNRIITIWVSSPERMPIAKILVDRSK